MTKTYEVTAKIAGSKRSKTHLAFKTQTKAQEYANETNKFYPGANARVVNGVQRKTVRCKK